MIFFQVVAATLTNSPEGIGNQVTGGTIRRNGRLPL